MTTDRYMESVRSYPAPAGILTGTLTMVGGVLVTLNDLELDPLGQSRLSGLAAAVIHRAVIRNTCPGATRQVRVRGIREAGEYTTTFHTIWPGQELDIPVRVHPEGVQLLLSGEPDEGPQPVDVTLYGEFSFPDGYNGGLTPTQSSCHTSPIAARLIIPGGSSQALAAAAFGPGSTERLGYFTPVGRAEVTVCHRTGSPDNVLIYGAQAGHPTYGFQLPPNERHSLELTRWDHCLFYSAIDIILECLATGTFRR